eukprot:CAMPEP_0172190834 /NCGR_PEP_ID=MMETSP1050-20130122/23340_1 /TAXON_ID=233186 /ORGANISM="Cryptomonas curvata, Strain CCAP979/52" /LENGTH=83 /DNA_ID=CAMNT_0012865765 /DNA_START=104 /DNA_END=352 /DNA_ORIENTATION=-
MEALYFVGSFSSSTGVDNVLRNISGVGELINGICRPLGLGVQLPAEALAVAYDSARTALYVGGSFHFANGAEVTRITMVANGS